MSSGKFALEDLLMRLARDRAFAQTVQADPGAYGLTAAEVALILAARVDPGSARPRRLEERRSRSGLVFGGEFFTAAGDSDVDWDDDGGRGLEGHGHHESLSRQDSHERVLDHARSGHDDDDRGAHGDHDRHETAGVQDRGEHHASDSRQWQAPHESHHPSEGARPESSTHADDSTSGQHPFTPGEHVAQPAIEPQEILDQLRDSLRDALRCEPQNGSDAAQVEAVSRAIATALREAQQCGQLPPGFGDDFAGVLATTLLGGGDATAVQVDGNHSAAWTPPSENQPEHAPPAPGGDDFTQRPQWVVPESVPDHDNDVSGVASAPAAEAPTFRPDTTTFDVGDHQISLVPGTDPPQFVAQKFDSAQVVPLTYADAVHKDGTVSRVFTHPDGQTDVVTYDIQWGAAAGGKGMPQEADGPATEAPPCRPAPVVGGWTGRADPSGWKP